MEDEKGEPQDLLSNILDRKFLHFLLQKLKIGNLRVSHLNCVVGRSRNRFSLKELDQIDNSYPREFLKRLFTSNSFKMPISIQLLEFDKKKPDSEDEEAMRKYEKEKERLDEENKRRGVMRKRLDNIAYDLKNEVQEYGTKSLGFGFPVLAIPDKNDPKRTVIAPLLVWYVDILKDNKVSNTWIIEKKEDSPIVFNQILFNYLAESHKIDFKELKDQEEEIWADGIIDLNEIKQLVNKFLKKMNVDSDYNLDVDNISQFEDLSNKESIRSKLESPSVLCNGAFAFYRAYKQSIIYDLENLIDNLDKIESEAAFDSYKNDSFAAISTDPSQSKLLEAIGKEQNILVQGPPGTGKSRSITAIITNAMKNQAKCLVVCEKKTAMEVIHQNLCAKGLGDFSIIIDDPVGDRQSTVKRIRDRFDKATHRYSQQFTYTGELSAQEQIYKTNRTLLENHHHNKNTKILGNMTRENLIGEVLKMREDQNPLDSVDSDPFSLTYEEYTLIKTECNKIFAMATFLKKEDSLLMINKESLEGSFDSVKSKLKTHIEILHSLSDDLVKESRSLEKAIENGLTQHFDHLFAEIENTTQEIENHYNALPEHEKIKISNSSISPSVIDKLFSLFSEGSKKELHFKDELLEALQKIISLCNESPYFNVDELIDIEKKPVGTILEILGRQLKDTSKESYLSDIVREIMSSLTIDSENKLGIKEWDKVNKTLEEYRTELNKGIILSEKTSLLSSELPILDFRQKCADANELIETLLPRIDYLHEYYLLNKTIEELEPQMKQIVQVLLKINGEQWEKLLNNWYFKSVLKKKDNGGILRNDYSIKEMRSSKEAIENTYINIIKEFWGAKALRELGNYKGSGINFRSIYNLRGSKGQRRNSLREIIRFDFEGFSSFYPVIITNPQTVSTIFPLKLGLFDVVIFDESSQLRIEDTLSSFLRGKFRIVSGDKHQMPPSAFFVKDVNLGEEEKEIVEPESMEELRTKFKNNQFRGLIESESLLGFAEKLDFTEAYLDIHYRSGHPDLIEFSNKAFYGSRLVPTPKKEDYIPIIFEQVDGTYNSEDNTNSKEAERVIDLITESYKKNPENTIGVATFNLKQRNLINDLIAKYRVEDPKFSKMMDELEKNGLFIKNLENIQGDERDIIIISTTFGRQEDGNFRQSFGPINRKGGYRLLNVIITRAKYKLYVLTSIPAEMYSRFADSLDKLGKDGRTIFYAYLSYAKAVSMGNDAEKERILRLLSDGQDEAENFTLASELTESPFEEEVSERLQKYIPEDKIHWQKQVGGFRIDIAVDTKIPNKEIAIECDGATYHRTIEDHAWDLFREDYLKKFGYVFHRIWSENWWDDPDAEMRKLLTFLEDEGAFVNN